MTKASRNKRIRHDKLLKIIETEPFLTDEEISKRLDVSIPTVRLDRLELGIRELRERIKAMARRTQENVRSLAGKDIVGELLDLDLNERGVAVFETAKRIRDVLPGFGLVPASTLSKAITRKRFS